MSGVRMLNGSLYCRVGSPLYKPPRLILHRTFQPVPVTMYVDSGETPGSPSTIAETMDTRKVDLTPWMDACSQNVC
jgi:hypothetical protein